jgi:hypothetical protein
MAHQRNSKQAPKPAVPADPWLRPYHFLDSCLNRVGESEAFGMFMRSLRHAYKAGSMMFWPEPQPRPVRQKRRKQNPRVAPARRQQRRSRARSRAVR